MKLRYMYIVSTIKLRKHVILIKQEDKKEGRADRILNMQHQDSKCLHK